MAARPPRPRAEADSGRERHGDPWRRCGTWEESGEGVRAFVDEKACFELASPREQLAECCEENRAGQGDPGGEAADGRRRPGAPLRSQPGPQAAGPGRGLEPRCVGVGGGGVELVLGLCLQFSGRVERGIGPVRPRLPNAQKCRAGDWRGYRQRGP